MNKVLLIIPAYNEQDSILSTISTIDAYNKNHSSNKLDYIVINDGSKDRKRSQKNKKNSEEEKENKTMKKVMKIEGMMCGHCEARVKKVLEALDGVEQAEVSHETGTAVVEMTEEVADEVLKKAVEDQDYKVLGIDF